MVKWNHKCDLGWLKARQACLTATDIKELLPVTKTGRARTVNDESYYKVLARKKVLLTEDDCISTGAMARGHILEPYAIDMFNERYAKKQLLNHWDDMVVVRKDHLLLDLGLGFSPDALDIQIPTRSNTVSSNTVYGAEPKVLGEVKSYSAERHFICGHTAKEKLEERWQIAAAMAVCPSIEDAYLIFFNPSMTRNQMFVVWYGRGNLTDEIQICLDIEKNMRKFINDAHATTSVSVESLDITEQSIINSIMEKESMNPTKSVSR